MKNFKNILVVYNDMIGAEGAVSQARWLALENSARLTLIDILPRSLNAHADVSARGRKLETIGSDLRSGGIKNIHTKVVVGVALDEILAQIDIAQHDLVVIGAGGSNSIVHKTHSSLALALMRESSCPVWLIKSDRTDPPARVLAAMTAKRRYSQTGPDASGVMSLASWFANSKNSELHILQDDGLGKTEPPNAIGLRSGRHQIRHLQDRVKRDDYDLPAQPDRLHALPALAEDHLAATARKRDIDLVIAEAPDPTGLLMGSPAEAVLYSVCHGVLVMKPRKSAPPGHGRNLSAAA